MAQHQLGEIMEITMEKIKQMVDVNTVVGDPINCCGTTVIPISKISIGFASGGSDIGTKNPSNLFGGGGGAGVSVNPVAFLSISSEGDVRLLQLANGKNTADRAVSLVPDLIDKVAGLFDKKKSTQ